MKDVMKKQRQARRKVIRQWTALPRDKRQSVEQIAAFAKMASRTRAHSSTAVAIRIRKSWRGFCRAPASERRGLEFIGEKSLEPALFTLLRHHTVFLVAIFSPTSPLRKERMVRTVPRNRGGSPLPPPLRPIAGRSNLVRPYKNREHWYLGIEIDDALAIAEQVDV